jgi:hypothetical protein
MSLLNLIFSSFEWEFATSVKMMSILAMVARISWVAVEAADADADAELADIVVDE